MKPNKSTKLLLYPKIRLPLLLNSLQIFLCFFSPEHPDMLQKNFGFLPSVKNKIVLTKLRRTPCFSPISPHPPYCQREKATSHCTNDSQIHILSFQLEFAHDTPIRIKARVWPTTLASRRYSPSHASLTTNEKTLIFGRTLAFEGEEFGVGIIIIINLWKDLWDNIPHASNFYLLSSIL